MQFVTIFQRNFAFFSSLVIMQPLGDHATKYLSKRHFLILILYIFKCLNGMGQEDVSSELIPYTSGVHAPGLLILDSGIDRFSKLGGASLYGEPITFELTKKHSV